MSDDTISFHSALADRGTWTADNCPVRKAMELIGTQSAMLLMREAYYGTTRFDDFAARAGITETVAAARLRELVDGGLLERAPYRDPGQRTRHEYLLTPMGRDFAVVVLGLFEWGAKYLFPDGEAPVRLRHTDCGTAVHVGLTCDHGDDVPLSEMTVEPARRRRAKAARSGVTR